MTEEEARTRLFNLRYQEKILKMGIARGEDKEAYAEELANVQDEIKIIRKEITRMKLSRGDSLTEYSPNSNDLSIFKQEMYTMIQQL